jgi:hypothetical protein
MVKHSSQTESSVLENYRIALENAVQNSRISQALGELGYDDQLLAEGRSLWEETKNLFLEKMEKATGKSDAYAHFAGKWEEFDELYSMHRKKAKVKFRKDPEVLEKLHIDRVSPRSYERWIKDVEVFYLTLKENEDLRSRLSVLKVTDEELARAAQLLEELLEKRRIFVDEKGEAQDATANKDLLFDRLDDWMSEFYATARIALEDNPELLESLSKQVKN